MLRDMFCRGLTGCFISQDSDHDMTNAMAGLSLWQQLTCLLNPWVKTYGPAIRPWTLMRMLLGEMVHC